MAIVILKIPILRFLFHKYSNGKDGMRLGLAKENSYELLNFDGFAFPLQFTFLFWNIFSQDGIRSVIKEL